MNALKLIAGCGGNWSGTSKLQDPHAGIAEESASTRVSAESDGSCRFSYTWSYQGKPQSGVLVLSSAADGVSAHWTDTWHTGNKPMTCTGPLPSGSAVSVRGNYAAPPGPDWGWRIDLTGEGERLRLVMWNVWPVEQGGKEELAVEADYARTA